MNQKKAKPNDFINVTTVKCPICGDIIYSRARHDFNVCKCNTIYIDGGFDYIRYGFMRDVKGGLNDIVLGGKTIKATKKILYNDWNKSKDKYGRIK